MSSGWGTKPLKHKTTKPPATWKEGRRVRQEERKAREERKASQVAAARWGPEPRPRDSEPDLIGVGRRELEPGGHSAGRSRRRDAQVRQRRGPKSRGGLLTARQALPPGPGSRRPGTRSGPRPTTTPGSPLPPPPSLFSPAPTGPALTLGRRSGPGLTSLTSTYCVTTSGSGWRGRLPSADYGRDEPRPPLPLVAGRSQPRGFGARRWLGRASWVEEILLRGRARLGPGCAGAGP